MDRGNDRYADIDRAAFRIDFHASVLGNARFGNVEIGLYFDTRNNGGFVTFGRRGDFVQDAVNPVTNAQFVFIRFDVDVTCPIVYGLFDNKINQLNNGLIEPDVP